MRLIRWLAVVSVAGVVGSVLGMPGARAAGSYDCFFGSRTGAQGGYQISANGCDGAGYVEVVIRVLSGTAAGSHRCRMAFSWNGTLSANGCQET